jgi:DNA-binding transcriptional LysR family regulator
MDMSLRLASLRAGIGYGSMPAWIVEPELKAGRLVKLSLEVALPDPLPLVVSYQGPRVLGPASRALVKAIASVVPTETPTRAR